LSPAMDAGTPTLTASEAAIENVSQRDGYRRGGSPNHVGQVQRRTKSI
jgi:hypothetical protein